MGDRTKKVIGSLSVIKSNCNQNEKVIINQFAPILKTPIESFYLSLQQGSLGPSCFESIDSYMDFYFEAG